MECARLRLHPEDRVIRIHRVRHHKGQVFLVEDVSLPATLFPGLAEKKAVTDRIIVLAQEYGILLGKAEERSRSPRRRRSPKSSGSLRRSRMVLEPARAGSGRSPSRVADSLVPLTGITWRRWSDGQLLGGESEDAPLQSASLAQHGLAR
jgi:hypothetical protein